MATVDGNVTLTPRPGLIISGRTKKGMEAAVKAARELITKGLPYIKDQALEVTRLSGGLGLAEVRLSDDFLGIIEDNFKLVAANLNQWQQALRDVVAHYTSIKQGIGGPFEIVDIPVGDTDRGSCSRYGGTHHMGVPGTSTANVGYPLLRGRIHLNFNLSNRKLITHRIGCQGVVMGLYFPHDLEHAGTSDQSQV
ncbi:MAG: hypothetical protein ACRERE_12130 [Candidatus Entotheonellia bacterium]